MAFSYNLFAQAPADSLICYLPFSGNTNDVSGKCNDGIAKGPVLTADRFGNDNNAYIFDGVNDFIELTQHISSFNIQQPVSISFWVKSATDSPQAVFALSDSTTPSEHISILGIGDNFTGSLERELITVSNRVSVSDVYTYGFATSDRSLLLDDKWHHIAVVYDNISTKIYLDMNLLSLEGTYTNNGHFGGMKGLNSITLGARRSGDLNGFLNGSLDDFRLYNKALTLNEIKSLYNDEGCLYYVTDTLKIYDTISVYDTIPVYDTISTYNSIKVYDTISVYDTIPVYYITKVYDTIAIYDTIPVYHSIKVYDTIAIYDTSYIKIKTSVEDTLVIKVVLSEMANQNIVNSIKIYPNPSRDFITIGYGDYANMNGYNLKIINSLGQEVYSTPINQQESYLNLSDWGGKGLYYVSIINKSNIILETKEIILK